MSRGRTDGTISADHLLLYIGIINTAFWAFTIAWLARIITSRAFHDKLRTAPSKRISTHTNVCVKKNFSQEYPTQWLPGLPPSGGATEIKISTSGLAYGGYNNIIYVAENLQGVKTLGKEVDGHQRCARLRRAIAPMMYWACMHSGLMGIVRWFDFCSMRLNFQ